MNLTNLEFTPEQYEKFKSEFSTNKLQSINFHGDHSALDSKRRLSGIYFIIGEPSEPNDTPNGRHRLKLYIGKSNNIHRRMNEYCGGFQPTSIDDFKHQALGKWLKKKRPDLHLAVYYKEIKDPTEALLNNAELAAIKFYNPLHNGNKGRELKKSPAFLELKEKLKLAYEECISTILDLKIAQSVGDSGKVEKKKQPENKPTLKSKQKALRRHHPLPCEDDFREHLKNSNLKYKSTPLCDARAAATDIGGIPHDANHNWYTSNRGNPRVGQNIESGWRKYCDFMIQHLSK